MNYFLTIVFILLGMLNIIYVHALTAIFYLLFSLFFMPPVVAIAKQKLGFPIPYLIKLIAAIAVLWGSFAVGELGDKFSF